MATNMVKDMDMVTDMEMDITRMIKLKKRKDLISYGSN